LGAWEAMGAMIRVLLGRDASTVARLKPEIQRRAERSPDP